jgi:hypothetical protein
MKEKVKTKDEVEMEWCRPNLGEIKREKADSHKALAELIIQISIIEKIDV